MNRCTVLIVDGENQLVDALADRDYEIFVSSAADALDAYASHRPDLVVVDGSGVPSSGLEMCRSLRAISDVAIFVVAAEMDEVDELLAYALGADDCMIGALSMDLFVAKAAALTRRKKPQIAAAESVVLRQGGLSLNATARQVQVAGQTVGLTRTEFDILALLMSRPDSAIKLEDMVQEVWPEWCGEDRAVEVHILRLRRKIYAAGGPRIVEAVRGVGYRLGLKQPVG